MNKYALFLIAAVALVCAVPAWAGALPNDGAVSTAPPYDAAASGPQLEGWAMSLWGPPRAQELGTGVLIHVEIKNISSDMPWLILPQIGCGYAFVVTNMQSHKRLSQHNARFGCDVFSIQEYVTAGRAAFEQFCLSDFVSLEQAGLYRVQVANVTVAQDPLGSKVSNIPLQSNEITVYLTGRRTSERVQQLLSLCV